MTATSLHGTAISVTQHPLGTNDGGPQAKTVVSKSSTTKLFDLPEEFSHVPEVVMIDRVRDRSFIMAGDGAECIF